MEVGTNGSLKPRGEMILGAILQLAEEFISKMTKFPDSADNAEWVYRASVHFFFCKSYKTCQAIRLLAHVGFLEDSQVLARTIFELSLQSRWMAGSPKERARLFTVHDPVRRYDWYLQMKRADLPQLKRIVESIEARSAGLGELRTRYEQFSPEFLRRGVQTATKPRDVQSNWWGNSIRWLGVEVGAESEYATVYWSQSDFVHTGSTALKDYLKQTDEGWIVNCYPTPKIDYALVAYWSARWMLFMMEILGNAWSLGMESRITETASKIERLFEGSSASGEDRS